MITSKAPMAAIDCHGWDRSLARGMAASEFWFSSLPLKWTEASFATFDDAIKKETTTTERTCS